MTTDVKLLPLPEVPADDDVLYAGAEDYARANMEPLLAENERLAEALREIEALSPLVGVSAARTIARAALEQEGGNG